VPTVVGVGCAGSGGVEPLPGTMQGLSASMGLAAHPDSLHEPRRGGVVSGAVRRDATRAELGEAEPEELADGLGGVAGVGMVGWSTQPRSTWAPFACGATSG